MGWVSVCLFMNHFDSFKGKMLSNLFYKVGFKILINKLNLFLKGSHYLIKQLKEPYGKELLK